MNRAASWFAIGILAVAGGGLAFRFPRLDARPMHPDEANQAYRAGVLLETGVYRYDPEEHHGPSLYRFTLPSMWLRGVMDFAHSRPADYRLVPVVFGTGLILLLLLLGDGLGRPAALAAGVLTAVSPAMVFFSRYYVQEMLLVFFTLSAIACGWQYARSRSIVWAILAGACFGLMHATKETWILSAAAMVSGLALALAWTRWLQSSRHTPCAVRGDVPSDRTIEADGTRSVPATFGAMAAVLAACLTAVILYASRDDAGHWNWRGPIDSVLAYATYFRRGSEGGIHAHPWYYYLELLFAYRPARGFFWSEGLIAGLAAVGALAALSRRGLPPAQRPLCRFLTFYTLVLTALYSAVRYKTPWCMLSFLDGMILLAGVGAWSLLRWSWTCTSKVGWVEGRDPRVSSGAQSAWVSHDSTHPTMKRRSLSYALTACLVLLLVAGTVHLGRQCYALNFRFPADQRNPYVYAHTTTDAANLAEQIQRLAEVSPEGRQMTVHVVTSEDYWPLPWYLRMLDPSHVGYWRDPAAWSRETAALPPPSVIILNPDLQGAIDPLLKAAYNQQMHFGLRHGVLLVVYVREDLWQAFTAAAR